MNEGEQLVELAKRRGFFFPANEAYGGTGGFYVYGPQGAGVKDNIESSWRELFVVQEGNMEIQTPTIMPEAVFEASGHLDGFDDLLVECPACHETHRADHLIEGATELEDVESRSPEEVSELLEEYEIRCPSCNTELGNEPVEEFNLMFGTNIGPGASTPGYLRPETAQGIFVEFPRLSEYARGQLPAGVAQIGTAYRNEISPRRGLIRLREFTQAELELFIDPETDEPAVSDVADEELRLYPVSNQHSESDGVVTYSVEDAIAEGIIGSDWVAYYLGISNGWFEEIGIDPDRFRFRQHLSGERAHYAADCWDAEVEINGNWIEVTGFAYRSDYDLRKHGEYADEDYTVFKQYDEPIREEQARLEPDMSYFGPEFGDAATEVVEALEAELERDPGAFAREFVDVEVDEEQVSVPVDKTGFVVEETTISGEHIIPHVIEPSFGIDRLVYAVLAHSMEEDVIDDEERTVLALPDAMAPTFVGVFPLMDRDGLGAKAQEITAVLRDEGFSVMYDDSGSIGRRYRRQDEIGTPYCVTVDYESLEDDTVTLRDRDSAVQRRVGIDSLTPVLDRLRSGEVSFQQVSSEIPET